MVTEALHPIRLSFSYYAKRNMHIFYSLEGQSWNRHTALHSVTSGSRKALSAAEYKYTPYFGFVFKKQWKKKFSLLSIIMRYVLLGT